MTFFESLIIAGCALSIGMACLGAFLAEFHDRPLAETGPGSDDGVAAAATVTPPATAAPLAPPMARSAQVQAPAAAASTRGELKEALINSLESDDLAGSFEILKQLIRQARPADARQGEAHKNNWDDQELFDSPAEEHQTAPARRQKVI